MMRVAWASWSVLALVFGVPILFYMPFAETWNARVLGFGVCAWIVGALFALAARRRIAAVGAACGLVALVFGFAAAPSPPTPQMYARSVRSAPNPHELDPAYVASVFTAEHPYRRYNVANVVPEIDQTKFGSYLAPLLDPIITVQSARSVRDWTAVVYRDMDQDPAFRALGSAMPYAYADSDSGHLYAYVPARSSAERLKVVLFLHGSAGNFKVYTHILKSLADAEHAIIVAPSFGFGNWHEQGGVAAIERARHYAIDVLGGDAARIVLVGLSNGGRGVTRAIRDHGDAYAGFVFLSGVIESAVITQTEFMQNAHNQEALVVYGERDDRIPASYTLAAITALRAAGVRTQVEAYQDADHFALFSHKNAVLSTLADYLRRVTPGR